MKITAQALADVNKKILKYYLCRFDKSKRAQEYVLGRISAAVATKRLLGYAPKDGFIEFINNSNIKISHIKRLGLIYQDYAGYSYPRFSDRIIIPIIHARRIVGFGGRTLTNELPKYINSKNSILYNKSSVLYGLSFSRKFIEKSDFVFIVEGYFDVLGLYTHGIKNCVAICGTALSNAQIDLIKRHTNNVCILLDPDDAGQAAARRIKKTLEKSKVCAVNLKLPEAMDPADYVVSYSAKKLTRLAEKKLNG